MIECVPNFSEGQDPAVLRALLDAIAGVPGAVVLGWEANADHHRSVVTLAGPAEAVMEAAIRVVGTAVELIDLTKHRGAHPRVGAADVVPFVPLEGATLSECVDIAYRAGAEMWRRFRVPVYFYEAAALRVERQRLEKVRRPGFDGLPPDIGDQPEHPTAGAVMVGARPFLVAYNIDLETADVSVANAIARKIRGSSGGFPFVKAMGLYLPSARRAQVSMNLTNYAEIPLERLYEAVRQEAGRLDTAIAGSELIGFVPKQAYETAPLFFRRARGFDESRIVETRMAQLLESK
jgi:glutamate formiminotransferase